MIKTKTIKAMKPALLKQRYQVLEQLGDGGFSKTFLAEDTQIPSNRKCVIKQLKPVIEDPKMHKLVQDKFQKEARILEEVGEGSDRIPRLYAYFQENDRFYLVQEWIAGLTLSQKVEREGILTESQVKEILQDILPVLNYIHSKGIIHRDIKPDNIILRALDSKPVLIDFGAVKETMGTNFASDSTSSIVVGTPGFMPSEQSIGRAVLATDFYSLGLTAIYLLTGKIPQDFATEPKTGAILWREYAPNISIDFAALLDKSIQSNWRDRYHNSQEMEQALLSLDGQSEVNLTKIPATVIDKPKIEKSAPLSLSKKFFSGILIVGGASILLGTINSLINSPKKNDSSSPIVSSQEKNNLNTPPQIIINGRKETAQEPRNVSLDGYWILKFKIGNTVHQTQLVIQGKYGEMKTQFVDLQTNNTGTVIQNVRLWSFSQGLILQGHNPVYADSRKPNPSYDADRFFLQPTGNGNISITNCSAGVCFPVQAKFLGKKNS